jgi:Zn ribbon nucleic-acid-binding protein
MSEVIFIVEESPEGGYSARALGPSIFTQADDWQELKTNVRDAVSCHFEEGQAPKVVRLHMVHEEVIAL